MSADLTAGAAYLAACLLLLLPLIAVPVSAAGRGIVLFATAVVWVSHLTRPLILLRVPEWFAYPRIGVPDQYDHVHALLRIGLLGCSLLLGLALGLRRVEGARERGSIQQPLRSEERRVG